MAMTFPAAGACLPQRADPLVDNMFPSDFLALINRGVFSQNQASNRMFRPPLEIQKILY